MLWLKSSLTPSNSSLATTAELICHRCHTACGPGRQAVFHLLAGTDIPQPIFSLANGDRIYVLCVGCIPFKEAYHRLLSHRYCVRENSTPHETKYERVENRRDTEKGDNTDAAETESENNGQ